MFSFKKSSRRRNPLHEDLAFILGAGVGIRQNRVRRERTNIYIPRNTGWGIVRSSRVGRDWFQTQEPHSTSSLIPRELFCDTPMLEITAPATSRSSTPSLSLTSPPSTPQSSIPSSPTSTSNQQFEKHKSVFTEIGNWNYESGNRETLLTAPQTSFLETGKIQAAFTTARLSVANDENRCIQSPWLSRDSAQGPYTASTSKLSVLDMFELCTKSSLSEGESAFLPFF